MEKPRILKIRVLFSILTLLVLFISSLCLVYFNNLQLSQAHPRGTVLYFADNKGLNFFVKNEQGEGFDFHYSIFQNGWEIQQEKVHLETGEEKLIQVRTDNIFDASLVTISLKTSTSDLEISRYLYKRKE